MKEVHKKIEKKIKDISAHQCANEYLTSFFNNLILSQYKTN